MNARNWLWLALLATMTIRHYAWEWVPAQHAGDVSKALGGAATLALLWVIYLQADHHKLTRLALWLYAWHEAQVVLCATWFIFDPWPIALGQGMCNAKIGFDIGAVGMLLTAIVLSQGVKAYRGSKWR